MSEDQELKSNIKVESDLLAMMERERNASIRERQFTQNAFLQAIEKQTDRQAQAMNTLGDRFENSISEIRQDLRSASRQMVAVIIISILVIASLAGVSVSYFYDGSSTSLDLNKQKQPVNIVEKK